MELYRKLYNELLDWKKEQGQTALLIEGARRVGKTTLALEFAKKEYESYILIDFSIASKDMKALFIDYANSLDDFFFFLSTLTSTQLTKRNSLIIFDEVQLFPQARQLIKHLVKDNRYDYIETGSLLSIKQNVKDILLPSEEKALMMQPLDFEEFLIALNEKDLVKTIQEHFKTLKPLGPIHNLVMKYFRQYLLVGGMPQSVLAFVETSDFTKVDQIKRNILRLYRNDIIKYAKGYESKVLQIFDEIPSQLSKHENRFKLSSLSKDARFRDYEDAFMWLDEAMLTNACFNADDPQVALALYKNRLTLKLYMADTGLLLSHAYDLKSEATREIAIKIISDQMDANHGMIYENMVAQMLKVNHSKLYFYSRFDRDNSNNTMEIDFLINDPFNALKLSPIEVKSSKRYKTRSLEKFKAKFKSRIGHRFLLHTKDLSVKEDIIYLPIYMASFL